MTRLRAGVLILLAAAGCTQLDPGVTYPCTVDRRCHEARLTCWSDGYCRATLEPDAGHDAGPLDAGDHDAGAPDAGAPDGGEAPDCTCPATTQCGFVDAGPGCGTVLCGVCGAGLECSANSCAPTRLCRPDGWCFENPSPQGATLNALWSPDGRRVLMAGDDATLLEWDGERHRYVTFPPGLGVEGVDFRGVHGFSADDYFVVGTHGTVLHFIDGGWQRELLDALVDARLDVVLAGEPTVMFGEHASVFLRRDTLWESINTVNFGGGVINDALQSASGVQFAIGTSLAGQNAELSSRAPDGGLRWRLRDNNLGLSRGSGLVEVGEDLFIAGEARDGGGALVRWSPDGGARTTVHFDEPLRAVRSGRGELLVLRGEKVARVSLGLARAPEPLSWSGGALRTQGGASLFADGGALPSAPVEFTGPGPLNAAALTTHGWLAEGLGGHAAFLAHDGGLVALSGGVRGARVVDLCEDERGLFGAAAEVCTSAVCASRVFQRSDAGVWSLDVAVRRDGGELGVMLRCHPSPLGRAFGTNTSRTVVQLGPGWIDDVPDVFPPARDFLVSNYSRGWFVNTGSTLTRSHGALVQSTVSEVVPYDAGGDLALAVGGAFGKASWAVGMRGLVLLLDADGGVGAPERLGTETLRAAAGVELADGGELVLLAGDRGALYRLDEDAGFSAVPFSADLHLSRVALSRAGDVVLGAQVGDGGAARPLFWGSPRSGFVELPHQGSAVPAVYVRRVDAGVELWLGGPEGAVLRRSP